MIWRFFTSPSNWCGLALSIGVLILQGMGLIGNWGISLPLAGYLVGFIAGSLALGWPQLKQDPLQALEFGQALGEGKDAMLTALGWVRSVTQLNPDNRLSGELKNRILQLCDAMEDLVGQWERSRGQLSLEETFHAQHLAMEYLPDALRSYLSIPAQYARSKKLPNGQTAQETFEATLSDLASKVNELTNDLAEQDAEAFLVHSQFLAKKFGKPRETVTLGSR